LTGLFADEEIDQVDSAAVTGEGDSEEE
jgi:hypothetical protein